MQRQIQVLKQLVLDSQYAVDETIVAEAIVARVMARRAVVGVSFRNDLHSSDARNAAAQVRSFRPTTRARSFRPCGVKSSGGAFS